MVIHYTVKYVNLQCCHEEGTSFRQLQSQLVILELKGIAVNILHKISFVYYTELRVLNTLFSCHENEYIYEKIKCKRVPKTGRERADHSSYRPASFSRNSSTLITVMPRGRMVVYLTSDAICYAAWSQFMFFHEDKETK